MALESIRDQISEVVGDFGSEDEIGHGAEMHIRIIPNLIRQIVSEEFDDQIQEKLKVVQNLVRREDICFASPDIPNDTPLNERIYSGQRKVSDAGGSRLRIVVADNVYSSVISQDDIEAVKKRLKEVILETHDKYQDLASKGLFRTDEL